MRENLLREREAQRWQDKSLVHACMCVLSCVQLFVTSWTMAHQAPLSKEFSRQEYWSGLPFSTSGDLPDPGIEPASLAVPALAVRFVTTEPPGKHGIRYTGLNPLCVL